MPLMRCLVKRDSDTLVRRDGIEYVFKQQADGTGVCEVQRDVHVKQFLASKQFEIIGGSLLSAQTVDHYTPEKKEQVNDEEMRTFSNMAPGCGKVNPPGKPEERDPLDEAINIRGSIDFMERQLKNEKDDNKKQIIKGRIAELQTALAGIEEKLNGGAEKAPVKPKQKRTYKKRKSIKKTEAA